MDDHGDRAESDLGGRASEIDWAAWAMVAEETMQGRRPMTTRLCIAISAMAHGVGFHRLGPQRDSVMIERMLALCARFWRAAERVAGHYVPRELGPFCDVDAVPTPWVIASRAYRAWESPRPGCTLIAAGTLNHIASIKSIKRNTLDVKDAENDLIAAALAAVSDPLARRRHAVAVPAVAPDASAGATHGMATPTTTDDPRRYDIVLASPTAAAYTTCTLYIDGRPHHTVVDRVKKSSPSVFVRYDRNASDPTIRDAVATVNALYPTLPEHDEQHRLLEDIARSTRDIDVMYTGDICVEGLRWHCDAGAGLLSAIVDDIGHPRIPAPGWFPSPPFASVSLTSEAIHRLFRHRRLYRLARDALVYAPSGYACPQKHDYAVCTTRPKGDETLAERCARAYAGSLATARAAVPADVLPVLAQHAAWRLCLGVVAFGQGPGRGDCLTACLADDRDAQLTVMVGAMQIPRTRGFTDCPYLVASDIMTGLVESGERARHPPLADPTVK
ncbi:hypothetical protein pdul_cds_391 [Pandoravirus dulcis]|uniref:Uncharacterized protein n=1 Tax=Pandoravirus dulcis TaxID=1349409 RepID=S4VSQ5_9VIRU|nr:hypothetical protein pdul_cds_391 [Pandoravirus dulcis]AGO82430.1 hypothetical protein pdul_cds_391 [Pandoravirus dulcis]